LGTGDGDGELGREVEERENEEEKENGNRDAGIAGGIPARCDPQGGGREEGEDERGNEHGLT